MNPVAIQEDGRILRLRQRRRASQREHGKQPD